jgi:hypothetical protein
MQPACEWGVRNMGEIVRIAEAREIHRQADARR